MKFKIKNILLIIAVLSMLFMVDISGAKADTFYVTFLSECESEEWFVSYINSQFINNGKRFSAMTSADDPILLNIKELIFPASGIKKIPVAVKYLKNLEKVDLSYNEISDISALNACDGLKYINVNGNNIKSIDISRFKSLKEVSASENKLEAMPAISGNTELERIDFSRNNISSLMDISRNLKLEYLDLSRNLITSGEYIGKITMKPNGLGYVNMSHNRISGIGFLSNAEGICILDMSFNFIVTGIDSIPSSVKTLNLAQNGIKDITPVSKLTELVNLDISDNKINDATLLAYCKKLKTLNISHNELESFNPFIYDDYMGTNASKYHYLSELESLDISYNRFNELPANQHMKKLKVLNISHNNISSIALLYKYGSLSYLDASYNNISDIEALSAMYDIYYADFSYNRVNTVPWDLSVTTPKLSVLKLSGNSFTAEEIKNILNSNYREIWLSDMDLAGKIPDMSSYDGIFELYMSGSQLTAGDINNLLAKKGYTGLGLGGVIDNDIAQRLKEQSDLIALDLSGTTNLSDIAKSISELNILSLNINNSQLDVFPEVLLDSNIKNIDFSGNKLKSLSKETINTAALKGIGIDFSDNVIFKNEREILYFRTLFDFSGNFADTYYDYELKMVKNSIMLYAGDKLNIDELIEIKNIYTDEKLNVPLKTIVDIENDADQSIIFSDDGFTMQMPDTKLSFNGFTVKANLRDMDREVFSDEVFIYSYEIPFVEDKVDDVDVIYGIDIGTTFREVIGQLGINDTYSIEAYKNIDGNQTEADLDDCVGTGSRIIVRKNDIVVFDKYIIIFGDCDGDGRINSIDYMIVRLHIFRKSMLTGIYFAAGDVYENDTINSIDYMMIRLHIFGKSDISQRKKGEESQEPVYSESTIVEDDQFLLDK